MIALLFLAMPCTIGNPSEDASISSENRSNHPPAKLGGFHFVSRSKRRNGVADAAPQFWAT